MSKPFSNDSSVRSEALEISCEGCTVTSGATATSDALFGTHHSSSSGGNGAAGKGSDGGSIGRALPYMSHCSLNAVTICELLRLLKLASVSGLVSDEAKATTGCTSCCPMLWSDTFVSPRDSTKVSASRPFLGCICVVSPFEASGKSKIFFSLTMGFTCPTGLLSSILIRCCCFWSLKPQVFSSFTGGSRGCSCGIPTPSARMSCIV